MTSLSWFTKSSTTDWIRGSWTSAMAKCLGQVAARFAGAWIRSFVPLLVRRYAREELQALHGQSN
jgi:hypothetical protein